MCFHYLGTGKYMEGGKANCDEKCEFIPEILDVIQPEQEIDDYVPQTGVTMNPRKFCRVPDQSGCVIVFDYR